MSPDIQPKVARSGRACLVLAVQGTLSALLLAYLFWNIDLTEAFAAAAGADLTLLAVAVLQLSLQIFLGAIRWQIVTAGLGGDLTFRPAVRYTWIGTFFNQALPASVGGDMIRIWLYWLHTRNRRIAVHSVMLERLVMMGSLLLLVLIVQPGLAARGAPVTIVLTDAIALAALAAALVVLIAARPVLALRRNWLPIRLLSVVADDVRVVFASVPRSILVCLFAVAAHINIAVTAWLIAQALGLRVSLADCTVLMPVVVLAATLPISMGGWGIRESVAVTLLGLVGVSSAQALALSILLGIAGIVVSLPGSALWLWRRPAPPRVKAIIEEYTQLSDREPSFKGGPEQPLPRQG